jgi:hypothetical protein
VQLNASLSPFNEKESIMDALLRNGEFPPKNDKSWGEKKFP